VPNLSCIYSLDREFSAAPQLALLGAPDYRAVPNVKELAYGPAELETIEDIYRGYGGVIDLPRTGKGATEAAFWELAKQPGAAGGILHLSSHGSFETSEPMHSGLLLSAGKVDAAEIARTPLAYDEVVLSACHTGHRPTEVGGIPLSGDDVLGLPGAFLEAGVRSVLVSIPPAREDVTLRFMTLYHESRAEGILPLAALQAAQKEMLADPVYGTSPHLWLGFTVYGGR
jgi:CHAT domain-containing protein